MSMGWDTAAAMWAFTTETFEPVSMAACTGRLAGTAHSGTMASQEDRVHSTIMKALSRPMKEADPVASATAFLTTALRVLQPATGLYIRPAPASAVRATMVSPGPAHTRTPPEAAMHAVATPVAPMRGGATPVAGPQAPRGVKAAASIAPVLPAAERTGAALRAAARTVVLPVVAASPEAAIERPIRVCSARSRRGHPETAAAATMAGAMVTDTAVSAPADLWRALGRATVAEARGQFASGTARVDYSRRSIGERCRASFP